MKRLMMWGAACMVPVWCAAQTSIDTNATVVYPQKQTLVLSKDQESELKRFIKDDRQRQRDRTAAQKTKATVTRIYQDCDKGSHLVDEIKDMINHPERYIKRHRLEGIERKLQEWSSMPDSSTKTKAMRILRSMKQQLQTGGAR